MFGDTELQLERFRKRFGVTLVLPQNVAKEEEQLVLFPEAIAPMAIIAHTIEVPENTTTSDGFFSKFFWPSQIERLRRSPNGIIALVTPSGRLALVEIFMEVRAVEVLLNNVRYLPPVGTGELVFKSCLS